MENKKRELKSDELQEISGGTNEEIQEIYEYVRVHDPKGYEAVMGSQLPVNFAMFRYLHDKGVPVQRAFLNQDFANAYYVGDEQNPTRINHAEFMEILKQKI